MALTIGTRLGPYELFAKLGEGGMGEVYRARDTKLNRDVALKVLLDSVVGDPERVARFTREAHVLASLNHPHIAHLYGFEAGPPTAFLVMELVEGPTLADVIKTTPSGVPLDQALPIARQIADALEAAHEQGIIHRDLKPANIKVRDDGVVKVLDFGLARTLDPGLNSGPGTLDPGPTMTSPAMTTMGMILGTAAYMAPEQAKGRAVDKRADIWAFGVVLYEMLTGRRLFDGEDISETLAAVLRQEISLTVLSAATPARLVRLIGRCLERDPKQRLRDIGEARVEIARIEAGDADVAAPSHTTATVSPVVPPLWRRVLPWALTAASLLLALAVVLMRGASSSPRPAAPTRLQVALPPGIELAVSGAFSVCLSPNGSTLAFVGLRDGIRQVFRRQLDQDDIVTVPGTDNAFSCAFSPTGRELLVGLADSSLQRIGLFDGKSETVASTTSSYMGAWLPNGRVVFAKDGRLWMSGETAAATPTQLTDAQAGSTAIEMHPVAVPGGQAILFVSANPETPDSGRIEAVSLADKVRTRVVDRASSPVLTSTGDLLFLRDGVLLAAPFDARSLKTTGDATPVLSDLRVVRSSGASFGAMALSGTGVLAYVSTSTVRSEIVSMSRTHEEKILLSNLRPVANPRLWDERWLLLDELGAGLRVWDLKNKNQAPARLAEGWTFFPLFARDGQDVIFGMSNGLFKQPRDGSARPVQIAGSDAHESPSGLTPQDADVLFTKVADTSSGDIYALPIAGGKERALVATAAYEGGAQISPDGKWMAYISNELGGGFVGFEVFVLPYPALDVPHRLKVSSAGGTQPLWNPNRNLKDPEIVYRKGDKMMSVRLTLTPDGPKPTTPTELFSGFYAFGGGNTIANYSMAKDGDHFILAKQSGAALNVVLNWFETLKRVK